ncbi:hypothetical protein [Streptomyces olivaceiscleroticus]|uniref:Uncharacterized protein n=1 Tax=Streptomyces olivaceiscleroticus TaxID=68245 RepID=A0ABP3L1V5_9ACTN
MDVRGAVRRVLAGSPPVLLVTLPGATAERLAVEAGLRERGWPSAESPAAAAALVVAGEPPGPHVEWLGALWSGMPRPKAYVTVAGAAESGRALDAVPRLLIAEPLGAGPQPGPPHGVVSRPEDHEVPESHGGHADHGGHHGGLVAGLPMAERADDRDGLRLDQLHLSLGPALPDWPAGLVVDVALQGDVIQHAEVRPVPGGPPAQCSFWNEPWQRAARGEPVTRGAAERRRCAAHLDSVGRFLAVAGWPGPAARARRLRDAVLGGAGREELVGEVRPLVRQVGGSRTLRRLTTGIGSLPAARAKSVGVTGPAFVADGDAHARVRVWLKEIERSLSGLEDARALAVDAESAESAESTVGPRGRCDGLMSPSQALLDALPGLLRGAEFACARLIVASLDPDLDELQGAGHG